MPNSPELNYIIQGDGPPVILIHGMAASMYDWNSLAPELVQNGYQAITLDLLGHGDSPKPRDPNMYSFENIKQQISQWISSLDLTPPLWLIGHSLGGLLCLTYGFDHQNEVRGMVLVDPFYRSNQLSPIIRLLNNRPEIWGRAMGLVPNWLINAFAGWEIKANHRISDSSRQQIADDYRRASPHILEITKSVPNLDDQLSEMDLPVLVIWGEEDLTLKPNSFPILVESLPNASGQVLPNCGHQPHLSKPDLCNHLILDFIVKNSKNTESE